MACLDTDRFTYGCDLDSNRTSRNTTLAPGGLLRGPTNPCSEGQIGKGSEVAALLNVCERTVRKLAMLLSAGKPMA